MTEIYEFLEYLNCPRCVIDKAPSAGLFDGQTDESEIGISYKTVDEYLLNGNISEDIKEKIETRHILSEHKRNQPKTYQ